MKFWRIFPGMSCLPCLSSHVTKIKRERTSPPKDHVPAHAHETKKKKKSGGEANKKFTNVNQDGIDAWHFTFRELATATRNFKQDCLLGEGAFSKVFKGTLKGTGKVVAVKQLDRSGLQENGEFLVEVKALSLLKHENLVDLIGYCAEGDQRLLVYEYLPGGTVEHRLLDSGGNKEELDWLMRMKIAYGAAKGLEYLHGSFDPPIIHGYLKSSNIMLDECLQPKLTDFGLAKLGSAESNMHVSSRAMRTYGYCAPEYTSTGELTTKSDVYSFGVVLLELICGRRAIDPTKPPGEQNLVTWASPKFRDPKLFPDLAEPLLEGKFPEKHLNQAVAIAAMCLQEEASVRPLMCDLVTALSFLSADPDEHVPDSIAVVDQLIESLHKRDNETGNGKDNDSETDD